MSSARTPAQGWGRTLRPRDQILGVQLSRAGARFVISRPQAAARHVHELPVSCTAPAPIDECRRSHRLSRDPCLLCPGERDHRDHPAGLLLVLAERRSPLHLRGEGTIALLADERRRNRVEPVGANLDLDVRIGDEIPVPVRMLRRTSLRREDEQPVAVRAYATGVVCERPLRRPVVVRSRRSRPSQRPPTLPPFARNSSMIGWFQSFMSSPE